MIIFPAIDIRGGNCVRLQEGDFSRETVFGDDPVAMARKFQDAGAEYLHVIDLDGAKGDGENNTAIIHEIARTLTVPIQTGGGIRDLARVRLILDGGVLRAIIGTAAFRDPAFLKKACAEFPEQVALSIDVRDGYIATHGWQDTTDIKDEDFLKQVEGWGVAALVYTDISKDGMLQGINREALHRISQSTSIPLVASGGVTTIDDVKILDEMGAYGVIIGRALYSGAITLEQLQPYFKK